MKCLNKLSKGKMLRYGVIVLGVPHHSKNKTTSQTNRMLQLPFSHIHKLQNAKCYINIFQKAAYDTFFW